MAGLFIQNKPTTEHPLLIQTYIIVILSVCGDLGEEVISSDTDMGTASFHC